MDLSGIHHINGVHGINAPHFAEKGVKEVQEAAKSAPIQDEIEISTTAERLSAVGETAGVSEGGEIRFDLVNRIRDEIAAGTYDTPERMDIAMERFLSRIG